MSSRTGGRQNMSELKLRRLLEHNQRLREDLARPRLKVSEASARYVSAVLGFPLTQLIDPLAFAVLFDIAKLQRTTSFVVS